MITADVNIFSDRATVVLHPEKARDRKALELVCQGQKWAKVQMAAATENGVTFELCDAAPSIEPVKQTGDRTDVTNNDVMILFGALQAMEFHVARILQRHQAQLEEILDVAELSSLRNAVVITQQALLKFRQSEAMVTER